jgi:hypothetical protein
MTVVDVRHVEDCFDGRSVYDIVLSEATDPAFVEYLAGFGSVDHYPDFPKPLFRGLVHDVSVAGIVGERHFRITLSPTRLEDALGWFRRTLAAR